MTTNTPSSRPVNWRAAIILPGNPQPMHGRIAELSDKQLIAFFPHSIHAKECRLYIDMPDPDHKSAHCYLDCKVRITAQTLAGKISEFRVFMQITELKDEQRTLLNRALRL
ncbi:hypothetical protein [Chitinilyticum piscinae]|uniref:PilZ domain-containing protein n=1 Tax=Chitinilyticum piscinae TaxID=2866724 RepID=A0A8J7FL78_9NEIS|nr:hypothetical protein [Chitinilyticum piscinae]MBE9609825.1 hypothetical protein [Chitinilyticum piscinae]